MKESEHATGSSNHWNLGDRPSAFAGRVLNPPCHGLARSRGIQRCVGEALIDGGDVASSTVSVVIGTASVDTRNEGRDEHLRSADFFNVEEYPEMRFEATGIDEVDENSFVVTGPLTIRGVTKTVSLPLELIGINTDHMGMLRAGLEGTRRIDRKDWEVSWNKALDSSGLLVSDKITLEFELSLIKSQDPEVPSKSSQDKRSS